MKTKSLLSFLLFVLLMTACTSSDDGNDSPGKKSTDGSLATLCQQWIDEDTGHGQGTTSAITALKNFLNKEHPNDQFSFVVDNTAGVTQGEDLVEPQMTLNAVTMIMGIKTYHWNLESLPGYDESKTITVWLEDESGKKYCVTDRNHWEYASLGRKADWISFPAEMVPAGTYTIKCSNNASWSYNSLSNNRGFVIVYGYQPSAPQTRSTNASINFGSGSSMSTEGCKLMTLSGEMELDGKSSVSAELLKNDDTPQVSMVVSKSGKTLLINRQIAGTNTKLDANSTALAYVTMHPIFATVKGKANFDKLIKEVKNAPSFNKLESAVAKYVNEGEEPLRKDHEDVVEALTEVVNSLCNGVDPGMATRAAIINLPDAGDFLEVAVKGQQLKLNSKGLTPKYNGKILNNKNDVVKEFSVDAGEDYGITEFWYKSWSEFAIRSSYGVDMSSFANGEYRFDLDRKNTECVCDLAVSLMCNALDVLGFKMSQLNNSSLRESLFRFALARASGIVSMCADNKVEFGEKLEFMWGTTLDAITSDMMKELVGAAAQGAVLAAAKQLSGAYSIYCAMRGAGNGCLRIFTALDTPWQFSFCICKEGNKELHSCDEVSLEIIGDEEIEFDPEEESEAYLQAKVNPFNSGSKSSYYNVHFETVNGGKLWKNSVKAYSDRNYEVINTFTTEDTLSIQQVCAYVTDIVTGKAISNEVYFTIKLKNKEVIAPFLNFTSSSNWSISEEEHELHPEFMTNCKMVIWNPSDSWIECNSQNWSKTLTDGSRLGYLNVKVKENTDTKERKGSITVSGLDESNNIVCTQTLTITQSGKSEKPGPVGPTELKDFLSDWQQIDYDGWQNITFNENGSWSSEMWAIEFEYSEDGQTPPKQKSVKKGSWYGTFTYKRHPDEAQYLKWHSTFYAVYQIEMTCTGSSMPTGEYGSEFVGKSGTYIAYLKESDEYKVQMQINREKGDDVGMNEANISFDYILGIKYK